MTGELLRVMVCPPGNAGWDISGKAAAWRDLGFQHPPDFAAAQTQHEMLCRLLSESGAEVANAKLELLLYTAVMLWTFPAASPEVVNVAVPFTIRAWPSLVPP